MSSLIIWNPSKPEEADAAEMHFRFVVEKKYEAYYATRGEGLKLVKGKPMKSFDQKAGRVLFEPPWGRRISAATLVR